MGYRFSSISQRVVITCMSTQTSFKQTLSAVRATYDADKRQSEVAESAIWAYVYRPLSFYLTVPLIWARLSPNQVTLLGFSFAVLGLVLLAVGRPQSMLAGSICILVFVLLDHCDGNIARYTQRASAFGRLLDGFIDNLVYGSLSFFLGLGLCIQGARTAAGDDDVQLGLQSLSAAYPQLPLAWFVIGAAASCCHFLRIYLPEHVAQATGSAVSVLSAEPDDGDQTVAESHQSKRASGVYLARNIVHTLPIWMIVLAAVNCLWPLLVLLSGARVTALGLSAYRSLGKAKRELS